MTSIGANTLSPQSELRVSVFKLGKDFDYFSLGEIILDVGGLRVDPPDNPELQRIARRSFWIADSRGVKRLSPTEGPEAWINHLHKFYPTEPFRVSKATKLASS